jgi:tetratricopeptide (TPR) repeat protein
VALCALVLTGINGYTHFRDLDKRSNYVAYDYSKNVLRSLPPGSVVVMKKDVQLFSLWNRQIVEGERPDITVISQGLATSAWYRDGMAKRAPGIYIGPLKDAAGWQSLLEFNKGKDVYVSADAEYRQPPGFRDEPAGIVSRITAAPGTVRGGMLLDTLYACRGDYRYGAYREFFTPDLIEDYARARMVLGRSLYEKGDQSQARRNFYAALAMQPLFPMAWNYIGFTYFQEGAFGDAEQNYSTAARQYEDYYGLAGKYNARPESLDGIRRDWADVLVSRGVCAEKLGRTDESLAAYQQALAVDPGQTKAYFNRAVIFWNRQEWERVISDLEAALRVDPNNSEASFYLAKARAKQGR